MPLMRMNRAIATAIRDEMRADSSVIVMGEDVEPGGVFKTSEGLLDEFGPGRVRDTPISEMGFLGAAVGAAMMGLRPVVEIMYGEFLGVALDQLSTAAAKMRYLSGGALSVPLVVRASVGAGRGFGAQHSQTLETWFTATPGLKVVSPSCAQSAYSMLRGAIRDDNPVVVLEPRGGYGVRGPVSVGEDWVTPPGAAKTVAAGKDVTILALGSTVATALEVANKATSWTAEVIDLQTIIPWDREAVIESVLRTKRLAIIEESPASGGWGTDIAAFIGGHAFGTLAAPVLRIACPDVPVPANEEFEKRYLPTAEYASEQITQLITSSQLPAHWWEKESLGGA